mmetsp:Transcript_10967/g.23043  ORF Transcript_10967/g.23043 Transcript_10967/m.23043 type:complete len:340 (+) Transcript_10967:45-1064(+)
MSGAFMATLPSMALITSVKHTFLELPDEVSEERARHSLNRQLSDSALLTKTAWFPETELTPSKGAGCTLGASRWGGKRLSSCSTLASFGSSASFVSSSGDEERPEAVPAVTSKVLASEKEEDEEDGGGSGQEDCDQTLARIQSGCTTLMIRHIPRSFTQQAALKKIHEAGFADLYDFFYVPLDSKRRGNRGIAFINLTSVQAASEFFQVFNARSVNQACESIHSLKIAHVQGYKALVDLFKVSGSRWHKHRPLFAPTQPPKLQQQEQQEVVQESVGQPILTPGVAFSVAASTKASVPFVWIMHYGQISHSTNAFNFCPFCALPREGRNNFCTRCGASLS